MRHICFEANYKLEKPSPIANFLKDHSPLSGRSLRKYFFKGLVFRNGKKAHSQTLLKAGDRVTVYTLPENQDSLEAEAIPFKIVFEDQNLLVIDKPASLAVHPSGSIKSGTLANGVAYYFNKIGLKSKVRPVNRLDYGTSGLIIFAKNAQTQNVLSKEIMEGKIGRIYYAVVSGLVKDERGIIDLSISERKGTREVSTNGKKAVTEYQTLERFKEASLLEISLQTGRTHQIRIHLSAIGHPLYGDNQYGKKTPLIKRPALHAGKLVFHDSTYQIPTLETHWPKDFQSLIDNLI
ncbi:MAG: RluA family pseudouridine synthase [Firmicutes bacterium]|nr:RluA family pseudouridine synthase [Bacillota bacterium]